MLLTFTVSVSNKNDNPLQLYELMTESICCLVSSPTISRVASVMYTELQQNFESVLPLQEYS